MFRLPADCSGNCTSSLPTPSLVSQLLSYISTPTGFAIVVISVATIASLWWAADSWYGEHGLEVDAATMGGTTAYGTASRRKKARSRK